MGLPPTYLLTCTVGGVPLQLWLLQSPVQAVLVPAALLVGTLSRP